MAAVTPRKKPKGERKIPSRAKGANKTPQNDVFKKLQEPPFEDYWSKSDVSCGLKNGTLLQGVIRISANDYNEAYISDAREGPDYYIPGVWYRNRSMEGDTVAFEILSADKWEVYKGAKEGKDSVNNKELQSINLSLPADNPPVTAKPTLIDNLYNTTVCVAKPVPVTTENGKDLRLYRRTVKVVYIIEKGHRRASAGTVKVFNKTIGLALFSPRDSKQPRSVIQLNDLPDDFTKNHKKYETTLFICRILDWKTTDPFPTGKLMHSLGEAGEIEPETESILAEYDIDTDEYPPSVTEECIPNDSGQWNIPLDEISKRRDFRNNCVFTIDPSTAKDLDDAVHCKMISSGVYELGVHIADVSYFLRPGTELDKMASQRGTSVYLIQKVIPMLPRRLCEDLCSLNPHQDRLTFSVVWELSEEGELLDEWIGKSVINSKAKLSYEDAQRMIDDPRFPWQHSDYPCITKSEPVSNVVESVLMLNKITKHLRFLRQSRGSLRLDQPKLVFSVDTATGLPNGCSIYQHKESNKLIEECMLLANMAVAHKISQLLPDTALLRRHPPPKGKAIEHLRDQFRLLGVDFDCSSAGDIQQSLNRYISRAKGEEEKKVLMEKLVLVSLCCRAMELAQYFCTAVYKEEQYRHYALNVPRYTHFTSPIRRYPDIITHRLLAAAINKEDSVGLLPQDVEDIANHCNKKRKNAKIAEELSSNLFLGVFIRECGPVCQEGIVSGVLDKSFDVLLPELGIIKRVYCQNLSLAEYKYEVQNDRGFESPQLKLIWSSQNDKPTIINIFNTVKVSLRSIKSTLQFEAILVQE